MKKTLLILSAIFLFFAGCKKDDVIEASKVEVKNEVIEEGSSYIKINAEYVYPVEMAAVSLYLSEQENMSDAKVFECKMEGKSFSVEANGLKENKKYHYCYEFDNGYEKKTVYGEQRSFTTLDITMPKVTTNDVTDITISSAKCGGTVTSDGNAAVTARGVCWSTSPYPTPEEDSFTEDGTGIGSFVSYISGLTENTKYYVRAYATNEKGTAYGEQKEFTTLSSEGLPTVTTNEVTDITTNSATSGGNVTSDGNASVTAKGICWSTTPNPTVANEHTEDGTGTGSFVSYMTGLNHGTKYYVRAYATNRAGTAYGEQKEFTTEVNEELPIVTTNEITGITQTTATSGGNVTSDGNATVTARGVCWSTSQNPTIYDNKTTDGSGTGTYTSNISNLTHNTKYYVRAYATNEKGTSYGEQKEFTTMVNESMPVVTTNEIIGITQTTATCGGNVTSDGNAAVTARGVCWSTSQNPTISNSHTTDGNGTGSFTSSITGLTANTTYYVRAYATNEKGTSYGEQRSFTTLQNIELPTVTTTNVSNITQTTATSGGNVTSDGGAIVTARGVCWSTSQNPTISNSHTTDGNGTGSFTSSITGLTANTTYYVRAYATNEKGTNYGEQRSLKTNGTINGHEYVDLGLPSGLKWATCNVGADSPEDYGNYYAWGETTTKAEYTSGNSLTYGLSISELQSQGIIDGDHNLTPSHDAATANWGGSWRLPTKEELEELENNCTWEWTTQNGVNGRKVTGPNGNNIFLPAAGYRYGSSLSNAGEGGYYWISTPLESDSGNAYSLGFNSSNQVVYWYSRYDGQSVRPVAE